jgi:hypothetical protein
MKTQDVLPVILSILVIILVAVLEKQSKLFAALAATMPLATPLALWIVYSSNAGDRAVVSQFSLGLLLGILPTIAFLVAVWLAARYGMKLGPMILTGYGVWAAGAALLYVLRHALGIR